MSPSHCFVGNAKKDNCEKDLPAKDEFPQPIRQVDEIVLLSSPSNPDYKTSHSNSSQCLSTAISNVASDLRNLLDTSIVYDDIVTSKSDQETSEMINQTGSPKVLSKTSHGGQDLSVMEKTVNRRNAKGETPLHLAAIKV